MKARDLTVPIAVCLKPEDELSEFVEKLESTRLCKEMIGARSLPVLDVTGKLVGVISVKDVLKAIYPTYLYTADLSLFTWDGMLESMAEHIVGKKVSDVMTKNVLTVREDHSLMECVDHMLKQGISSIPVVDHDGRLLGMLYESDVFFAVTGALFGGK